MWLLAPRCEIKGSDTVLKNNPNLAVVDNLGQPGLSIDPCNYCMYNNCMEIEFDPKKDAVNIEKHGLSLASAAELEWNDLLAKQDDRGEYSELRMIGYAAIKNRVYCVVYTDRDYIRRIISLRKANKREVIYYASKI